MNLKVRSYLFILLVVGTLKFFAQNEAKIWYFGNGQGMDFSTSPPTLLTNGSIATTVGCASVCGPTGNLLFYTDGVTVWNQTHAVMANGAGLLGSSGAQNCVIVKKPQSPNLYYIFTVQGGGGAAGLCYSVVDMTLATGNGSVIAKNVPVHQLPLEEKISATKHCNQTDIWIAVHEANNNNFKSVLLTASGISTIVTSAITFTFGNAITSYTHTGVSKYGSLKFSHNGRKAADVFCTTNSLIPISSGGVTTYILETYDFDNSTGLFSNMYYPFGGSGPGNGFAFGTEFSPDGTKLYFSYLWAIVQLNHCMYPATGTGLIPTGDALPPNTWLGALQSGPDGKIYVANYGQNSLGVIHNPNAAGNACNYQASAISLGTATCGLGLPNFYTPYFEKPGYTFTTIPIAGQDCQTLGFIVPEKCPMLPFSQSPYSFSGYSITAYSWNFGDPQSGTLNLSTSATPTHSFTAPGAYTVQLLLSFYCGMTDTVRQVINIPPTPSVNVITPSISCGATNATVIVSGMTGAPSYTWMPVASGGSVNSNLPPGSYSVLVQDGNTGCLILKTFNTVAATIGNSVTSTTLCSYQSAGSATASPFSGSGQYSYLWSGSTSTTNIASNLPPGNYSVTVTDVQNNCIVTTTFQVIQKMPLLPNVTKSVNGILCTGNACSLSASASGGTAPYTFNWPGFSPGYSINCTSSIAGIYIYTLNVTDNTGCVSSVTTSIMFAPTPTVTVQNYSTCSGSQVVLSPLGGMSYFLFPGNILFTNTVAVSPLSSTVYTIIGQNNFCSTAVLSTVITLPSPTLQCSSNSPVCEGHNIILNSSGAQNYQWSGPLGFSSATQNATLLGAIPAASGIYILNAGLTNGCSSTATVNVVVNLKPQLQALFNSPLCVGQTLTLSATGALSYTWSGPAVFSNSSIHQVPAVSLSDAGIYTLTGKSAASCLNTSTLNIIVYSYPSLTVTSPPAICSGNSVVISATGAISYLWSNGVQTSGNLVNPASTTIYTVTGSNGPCSSTAMVKVRVDICTGISDNSNNCSIEVFPNPADEFVYIDSEKNFRFFIYSANGDFLRQVDKFQKTQSVYLGNLAKGLYFLVVEDACSVQKAIFKIVRN